MFKNFFKKTPPNKSDEDNGLFSPLQPVSKAEIEAHLSQSWQAPEVPQRQFELFVKKELEGYRAGQAVEVYDTLVSILKKNIDKLSDMTILEIGCSSGYYGEVLKIKGINAEYHGGDYSSPFIEFARQLYPNLDFQVQDACNLSYADNSFDIVISGCCLLHIMEYEQALSEAARVASDYVVFHRTPVLHNRETSFYIKKAYGVKMFEIHFNERELLGLMKKNRLKPVDVVTFGVNPDDALGDACAQKTYLCKKELQ